MDLTRTKAFARSVLSTRGRSPLELQIEITNICNFNCRMCPRGALDAPERHMTQEVFERILQGMGPEVRSIGLTGWGEPLVHPQILPWIDKIKTVDTAISVRLTTNGALLTTETIDGLIRVGLNGISISIDDTQTSDSAGHPNAVDVVERIRELARASRHRNPDIVLQPCIQTEGLDEIQRVIELAAEIDAAAVNLVRLDLTLSPGLTRPSLEEEHRMVNRAQSYGRECGVKVVSVNNLPYLGLANHFDRQCIRNFYHAYINVDGEVTPCCRLRMVSMGSLLQDNLQSIWTSESFENFLRTRHPVCNHCDALKRAHRPQQMTEESK